MKKFKFYALAFAAIAFAGCSDDVIDGQGASGTQGDGTPAYLTISFTANGGNSSRSTADDANNNGDHDGTIDDSNHHNTGEEAESKIQQALVVVSPATDGPGASGFAKLYSVLADAESTEDGFKIIDDQTGYYGNAQPIKITTGDYKVLVVINPTSSLASGNGLTQGVTDVSQVRQLYTDITTGQYAYTQIGTLENNYINAATSIGMGISKDGVVNTDALKATFLMANKLEAPVTLTEDNTPENPKEVTVDVERALSKITFREKKAADGVAANAYKVEVALNAPAITVENVTLSNGEEGQTYTLNEAEDAKENTIYVRYDEDGDFVAAYRAPQGEEDAYQLLTAVATTKWDDESTNKTNSYAVVDKDENGELSDAEKADVKIHFDPDAVTEKEDWYVQVQGYALVNLSNSINYVRHTVTGDVVQPFGTVSDKNFLWTPNWNAKNSVQFVDTNDDGIMEFPSDVDPTKWFYNTLEQVSNESKTLAITADGINWDAATRYKSFETLGTITNQTVTDENKHAHTPTPDPAIGKLMSYCFENSTDVEHQTHGLSTGISFVARIYSDAACTKPIDKLYLYAGHNYSSLQQIAEAYGNNVPKEIEELLKKESPSKEDLEAAHVTEYNSNICYYYTTEIKHFDNNDDDVLGPMEFAIMRNNIYSLSVSTITQIGDPYVDPTPNIPNESKEAALNVQVKMLPWIVRYNDIEF